MEIPLHRFKIHLLASFCVSFLWFFFYNLTANRLAILSVKLLKTRSHQISLIFQPICKPYVCNILQKRIKYMNVLAILRRIELMKKRTPRLIKGGSPFDLLHCIFSLYIIGAWRYLNIRKAMILFPLLQTFCLKPLFKLKVNINNSIKNSTYTLKNILFYITSTDDQSILCIQMT